jgi:hypothetical protein
MTFQIKAFKSWSTHDGGGYQFNLYHNKKKFAFVHNDGHGGCIDIEFSDAPYPNWTDTQNAKIWDDHVKSLGKWKSSFGAINGVEWFDHTDDTAIGILVEEYEMAKYRKKGILFKLLTDSEGSFRTINTHDMDEAVVYLDKQFGKGKYELV